MAAFDSRVSVFQITDTGAQLRDISPYITSIDGLPGVRGLADITALGDAGRKWNPTLEDVVIALEGFYDDTVSTGPDAVLGPLRTHTAAVAFDYGPKGKTTTLLKYSGTCWVRNYILMGRVGDVVRWRAELPVHGAVARGTYA